MPVGANFTGGAYAYTTGDIFFNPVLRIEDATVDLETIGLSYIHSFELFGKSARFDLLQAYQDGRWSGLLDGAPASVEREGFADTLLRFAINLIGAPPLTGKEFQAYRAGLDCETIVGIGLAMQLPTGEYYDNRLINLGNNRYSFTPQFGVVHNRGKWSMELTTSVTFATDNDEFFHGKQLRQDPFFVAQGHLIHTFRPGLWLGASVGYGYGGESIIDGVRAGDCKANLGWGVSFGIPVTRNFGFKLSYIGIRTQTDTGANTDTVTLACSLMW